MRSTCACNWILVWPLLILCCFTLLCSGQGPSLSTPDKSEEWGYIEVRKGAHMFWWLYRSPTQPTKEWPIVLWLQGGPGASGVGIGNFGEIGPLTTALVPRQYTWLQKADLLFVDSPVGAGFSYVENTSLLITKDEDAAADLVSLLQAFFEAHQELQASPLFVFAESYGGKHASLLGLALNEAIQSGKVKAKLAGVALGDSWISPIDSVLSWGPVLRFFSRVDEQQEATINGAAKIIQQQVSNGSYHAAIEGWKSLEDIIQNLTNNVDFYNLLTDQGQSSSSTSKDIKQVFSFLNFGNYIRNLRMLKNAKDTAPDLTTLMNGPIRKKLQIIPNTVIWTEISSPAFTSLEGEFMKDVIAKVDELIIAGVNVSIYSGQLDLICSTPGTEAWVKKLKWTGMAGFQSANRIPMYCNKTGGTAAFTRSYKNLAFYWILLSGHMVPADNPCIALDMLQMITNTR